MKREQNQEAKELQTAVGGKHINVTFRGGSPTPIFIKELSIKQADQAMLCIQNEMALANLFTDCEPEDLERLTPLSFNEVIEAGMEVNNDFFGYCLARAKRQADLQERLFPGMRERLLSQADKAMAAKLSVLKPLDGSAPESQP